MAPRIRAFAQLDVFASEPIRGNPLAVVLDADDLTDQQMAAFARWTNLSETTFVLPPTDPAADYRLRIFTPVGELPFAGHPTLGSAHAWLRAGGVPGGEKLVQECGIGLVSIRRDGDQLAFAAPPLLRSGPVADDVLDQALAGLQLERADIADAAWVVNGPPFLGIRLHSGQDVLDLDPDMAIIDQLQVGVIGPWGPDESARRGADVEVRAFIPGINVPEDPVTGSLNAGLAVWLIGAGVLPRTYVAAQGTALQRAGRVHVSTADDGTIWIGGESVTVISGTVNL